VLGNYLLGLREGLEATLVVSILIAYLVKTDRRAQLKWIWLGVGLAVGLAVAFTVGLGVQSRKLDTFSIELLGGVMSLIAVCFVTWMIFWMAGAARTIAGEMRGRIDDAAGRPLSLMLLAFLAVGREGMETGAFLWAFSRTGTGFDKSANAELTWAPFLWALAGILTAVALGYLMYRGAVSINLSRFFTWTGAMLIVVAAGVLSYGFGELIAVANIKGHSIPWGLAEPAFDISSWYDDGSWYGTFLGGMFNLHSSPSVLEVIAWLGYAVPALYLFLRSARRRAGGSAASNPDAAASVEGTASTGTP